MSLVANMITESRYDYCHIDLYTIILLIIARWQIFPLSQIFFISLNPVIPSMAAMCSTCPRRSTMEKREGNEIDGRQLFILFIPINKREP